MQICLNSPLPTFDTIMSSFRPLMTFPPKMPTVPSLLANLPKPMFPSLHVPNFQLMIHALELQSFQLVTTLMAIIKPILSKLKISLLSFLPKIPGLPGMTLVDLLSGNWQKLIAAVKIAIKNGFKLPGLPSPLYATIRIPDFEAVQTLQFIIINYLMIIAKLIPELIRQVTKKFKWPGLPGIPELPSMTMIIGMISKMLPPMNIPTLSDIKNTVAEKISDAQAKADAVTGLVKDAADKVQDLAATQIPKVPTANDVAARAKALLMDKTGKFDIMKLMSKASFPGLPPLPVIPLPLVFSFKMPEIEFALALKILYMHIITGFMKPIMDFILKTLKKYLGFAFPKICLNIPIKEMRTINPPSIG